MATLHAERLDYQWQTSVTIDINRLLVEYLATVSPCV